MGVKKKPKRNQKEKKRKTELEVELEVESELEKDLKPSSSTIFDQIKTTYLNLFPKEKDFTGKMYGRLTGFSSDRRIGGEALLLYLQSITPEVAKNTHNPYGHLLVLANDSNRVQIWKKKAWQKLQMDETQTGRILEKMLKPKQEV